MNSTEQLILANFPEDYYISLKQRHVQYRKISAVQLLNNLKTNLPLSNINNNKFTKIFTATINSDQ